jgi:hypothetical protein
VTQLEDPAVPRPAPSGDKAALPPDDKPAPLRFEGAFIRYVPRPPGAASLPPAAQRADPAAPTPLAPAKTEPSGSDSATAADPAAEAAAAMARMQQRLDRIAEVQRQASGAAGHATPGLQPAARRRNFEPGIIAAAAFVACMLVLGTYLAFAVPGPWLASEAPRRFGVEVMQLTRGTGMRAGDEIVVQAPGDGGIAIVSLATDLPASRYRGLAWDVADLPPNVQVRVLWFSDTDPGRVNSLPAIVEAGRVRTVIVAGASGWMGRIRGLGLSVAGALPRPYRVSAVSAKPMGAAEILSDRAAQWLSFEGWNGASINVVVGGSAVQDLPLPAAAGLAVGVAILLLLLIHRVRPALLPHVGIGVAVVFLGGWLVLDLRWSANLARQVALTTSTFAGKDDRDRRLADVDGVLYEFIDRARAVLPPSPQRVWVVSDAPFFNGRAAYHLYPHNVHFQPRDHTMPNPSFIKPGDWLLVFNRRGVEFNARNETVRGEGGAELPAELKLPGNAAALFRFK